MFLVRFIRVDAKPTEEYPYRTQEEAEKHFSLFLNDDSGLYKNISIYDDVRNQTAKILRFKGNKPAGVFCNHDCVRLNREFAEPEELHNLYAIINLNEETDRAEISCLTSGLTIPPVETVGLWMIRTVGTTLEDILNAGGFPESVSNILEMN